MFAFVMVVGNDTDGDHTRVIAACKDEDNLFEGCNKMFGKPLLNLFKSFLYDF